MPAAPANIDQLRNHVESLRLKREASDLQRYLEAADLMSRRVVREGWGDRVDPTEYLRDGARLSYFGDLAAATPQISRPEDRRNGDNAPFWSEETTHASIRGICRFIAATDEVALAAIENLCNYIVGMGFGYSAATVKPKRPAAPGPSKPVQPSADALAAADFVQSVVDAFLDHNDFEMDFERELFKRSRRDGEYFVGLRHRGGRTVEARCIDPSFVTEPDRPRDLEAYLNLGHSLDWKYGVATLPGDSTRVQGYFVSWYGDANDWDFYAPGEMCHLKLNVDREVKRGLSDFYPVYRNLLRAEKLLGNTLEGSAVQAAIAYIREHQPGPTAGDIEDFVAGLADERINVSTPRGAKTKNVRDVAPGTVIDTPHGMSYHAGPIGDAQRGKSFLDVVQGALRKVGVRWSMPEYLISGDASNGNFASTLVAEAPFTKFAEAEQGRYVAAYREMLWKAVAIVAARMGKDVRQIRRLVEISVDPPAVASRDRLEDHQIRSEEHAAGILSLDTWAAEAGRDLADEQAKGAKPQALTPAPDSTQADPSPSPQRPTPRQPAGGADTVSDTILNGAQIASAVQIVQAVASGELPQDAAINQLQQFFRLSREQAIAMIGSAAELGNEKRRQKAANPQPTLTQESITEAVQAALSNLSPAYQRWAGYP